VFTNTGIDLPPQTDETVTAVLESNDLPNLITGETGFAHSGDIKIWYERMIPKDSVKGSILLVMGYSSTAMLWSSNFYQPLVDAGYEVIRYDNRGVGASDWMANWDKNKPYTLEDMAKDGIAVLDAINISKAHIIGASMGGMIAQRMAISHQDRVATLTSIMSSGYMEDPEITPVSSEFTQKMLKYTLKFLLPPSEAGVMKFSIAMQDLLKGNGGYQPDMKSAAQRALFEMRNRKGYNSTAGDQHLAAIIASGSRLDELGTISAPCLVIHGKSDPLVYFAHAQKYAPLLPNAKTLYIDGMGHDLPSPYLSQIHTAILNLIAN
jgi:pimeloyl-ACP methyl ester carboxylesterase